MDDLLFHFHLGLMTHHFLYQYLYYHNKIYFILYLLFFHNFCVNIIEMLCFFEEIEVFKVDVQHILILAHQYFQMLLLKYLNCLCLISKYYFLFSSYFILYLENQYSPKFIIHFQHVDLQYYPRKNHFAFRSLHLLFSIYF